MTAPKEIVKPEPIGQINGAISLLFKINQYVLPAALLGLFGFIWGINNRVTRLEAFESAGPRFTEQDGKNLSSRLATVEARKIPPEWFETRVNRLENKIDDLSTAVNRHLAGVQHEGYGTSSKSRTAN